MSDLQKSLEGYRITLAEILYRLPDHPILLQSFIWQYEDKAPDYPRLNQFLDFWTHTIEGRIHTVRVCFKEMISPTELIYAGGQWTLH